MFSTVCSVNLYRLSPHFYTFFYTYPCLDPSEKARMPQPFEEEFTMPRAYEMSWDDKQKRWVKMYKGQRYTVACSVLGAPDTKDGSRVAANNWWKAKRAEIDAKNVPRPPLPLEDLYRAWVDWSSQEAPFAKELYDKKFAQAPESVIRRVVEGVVGALLSGEPMPPELAEKLPPARLLQVAKAVSELRGQPTAEPEQTAQAHCDRWIDAQRVKVRAGELSADGVDNKRICLSYFRDFLGGTADIKVIDAARLQGFYDWCILKEGWSKDYKAKVFGTARTFIRWLAEQGVIPLPMNIDSRSFTFNVGAKAVPTWTLEEFKTAQAAATGQLRLHLLLMVNCGFTQQDIADLKDREVDWTTGRITRKRSKMAKQGGVPVVSYPLWPRTFELLKEYRSGGELVLLTESGRPWKWKELTEGGKLRKSDNIASNYAHLKDKLGEFAKPLKELRKTAASLLESKGEYRGFSTLFLGHSPRSIADRHYVAPPQALFDQAVMWLGRQLGQVPS
jgi:integrase